MIKHNDPALGYSEHGDAILLEPRITAQPSQPGDDVVPEFADPRQSSKRPASQYKGRETLRHGLDPGHSRDGSDVCQA